MTELLYLENPNLFTIQAKIISSGKDKKTTSQYMLPCSRTKKPTYICTEANG